MFKVSTTLTLKLYNDLLYSVATIAFRLILTKFRPNSDQKIAENQTNFDIFIRNSVLQRLANRMLFQLRLFYIDDPKNTNVSQIKSTTN